MLMGFAPSNPDVSIVIHLDFSKLTNVKCEYSTLKVLCSNTDMRSTRQVNWTLATPTTMTSSCGHQAWNVRRGVSLAAKLSITDECEIEIATLASRLDSRTVCKETACAPTRTSNGRLATLLSISQNHNLMFAITASSITYVMLRATVYSFKVLLLWRMTTSANGAKNIGTSGRLTAKYLTPAVKEAKLSTKASDTLVQGPAAEASSSGRWFWLSLQFWRDFSPRGGEDGEQDASAWASLNSIQTMASLELCSPYHSILLASRAHSGRACKRSIYLTSQTSLVQERAMAIHTEHWTTMRRCWATTESEEDLQNKNR